MASDHAEDGPSIEDLAAEVASDYDRVEEEYYTDDVEDAAALETEDDATLALFDKSQRDLVTSVVDYNLGTLADLVSRKKIDLSPTYQRRFRWDAGRQSKLIESFLMNVPIPPIFLNEDRYSNYAVIDGKQRLYAVQEFIRGRFSPAVELLEDASEQAADGLAQVMVQAIASAIDNAALTGDGASNNPTGLLHDADVSHTSLAAALSRHARRSYGVGLRAKSRGHTPHGHAGAVPALPP